jgi:hypothetical protein
MACTMHLKSLPGQNILLFIYSLLRGHSHPLVKNSEESQHCDTQARTYSVLNESDHSHNGVHIGIPSCPLSLSIVLAIVDLHGSPPSICQSSACILASSANSLIELIQMNALQDIDGLSECIGRAIHEHLAKRNINIAWPQLESLNHPVLRVEAFLEDAGPKHDSRARSEKIASVRRCHYRTFHS